MRLFAAWLAACALLPDAALLAGCSRGPTLPRLEANDVILAFGDSLTYESDPIHPNAEGYRLGFSGDLLWMLILCEHKKRYLLNA